MSPAGRRPPPPERQGEGSRDAGGTTLTRTDRLVATLVDAQRRASADPRVRRAGSVASTVRLHSEHGVRAAANSVRPLGWTVAVLTIAAWIAGVELGWLELLTVAGVGLCVLVLSALFLIGGSVASVTVDLHPNRVEVGEQAAGRMVVTNRSGRHLLPLRVDLPVGAAVAAFDVPLLAPSRAHEELFHIPTAHRGVIDVGPARVVRGDPLGLLARVVSEARAVRLYVHPRTVRVPAIGGGFLRDLEGQASTELSPSDIAFHSLREYVVGDDSRHVHWRTSARTGQLMVQQYLDTRRAHVLVVLDNDGDGYEVPDDFETAVSIAGSIGIRALSDKQTLTVVAGGTVLASDSRNQLLDGLSAVDAQARPPARSAGATAGSPDDGLTNAARIGSRVAPSASVVVLITGGGTDLPAIRHVARRFSLDARIVAVRVTEHRRGFQVVQNTAVYDVGGLADLPAVVGSGLKW